MTLTDKTPRGEPHTLTFELDLRHPPVKVWRALTDPELLAQWLLPVVDPKLELAPSAAFALQAQPQPGWDGLVNCRVLELEPHRKLSYTWVVGDGWLDTVVTFTLEPTAAGTRLTIVQSGFKPDQKQAMGGTRYGWKMMGERLIDLLARTA
jgi:uncharacterized protein YndB with AHSA1/START domain